MGLMDTPWDEPAAKPDPLATNANGGTPGSQAGSMTGLSNTGVSTTNTPTLQPPPAVKSVTGSAIPGGAETAGVSGTWGGITTSAAPLDNATPGSVSTQTQQQVQGFDSQISAMLSKLGSATDPTQHAMAKDELSRTLFQQLSTAGHDVKWDGDNLMVDGRPYTVAGSTPAPTGVAGTGANGVPSRPADLASALSMANQIAYGGNAKHTDPNYWEKLWAHDPDYAWRRMLGEQAGPQDAATTGPFAGQSVGGGTAGDAGYQAPSFAPSSGMASALQSSLTAPRPAPATLAGVKAAGGIQDPALPSDLAGWRPSTSPLYTPGDISFSDIPEFTRESMLGEMTGDPTSMATGGLVNQILAHPESMDQHTTDTLKAQMKDTVAEQQQQEEQDMQSFGAASNISDSNWLASQRLASRRGRDMAVAKGNQDVDIQAAKQNQADRLNAAGVGLQAGSQRQSAVATATSAALQKSAVTGDRMQLREQVKQAAAQMQLSQDQVMSNFILDKERNLTSRYGIDLGAQIDLEKLNQSDSQHREDLMAKLAELEETLSMQKYGVDANTAMQKYGIDANTSLGRDKLAQDDSQFGASLNFQYDNLNNNINQSGWDRAAKMFGS